MDHWLVIALANRPTSVGTFHLKTKQIQLPKRNVLFAEYRTMEKIKKNLSVLTTTKLVRGFRFFRKTPWPENIYTSSVYDSPVMFVQVQVHKMCFGVLH